jgi:4-amino-4-deoxy-L-arabinose transferase-like glycosyltransferase
MTVEECAQQEVAPRSSASVPEIVWKPGLPTVLGFLAAFAAIWALYFTITEAPVAIKHDMTEAYAWGHEFQLGYNQHPPFWAWICGLWFSLFPRTRWAFALLSSLNAGIGLWGAWMAIGDFAGGRKRIAAWALLLLTPLYTFYAYRYDANTIFLSIWPWTLHFFMSSLQSRRIGDAIAFGVLVGLAVMSKYYALILVATCLFAALQHPSRGKYFAAAAPYVSAVVASLISAPHAWWLLTHQAPPLRYLANVSGQGWGLVLGHAGRTLLGALAMNLGVVVVVALATWTTRRSGITTSRRGASGQSLRILATLALAPFVLTILSALVLRNPITPEMTVGTFPLLPLLVIEVAGVGNIDRLYQISVRLAVVVTLGALALSPLVAYARTYLWADARNVAPYREVAIEATRIWHDRTSLPLAYVAGSYWYENAVAFYSPDRPSAFAFFDYSRNLWVTPEALARKGLLSVCVSDDSFCLTATARFVTPESTRTELSLSHVFWGQVAKPVQFVVTVIPPRL